MAMNISPDGIAITQRFFHVIDLLTKARHLRGLQTFTTRHNLNRRNIQHLKENPSNTVLKPEIIAILVRDYNVSGDWLLTGNGNIFRDGMDKPKATVWKNKSRQHKADGFDG